ncbi:hypothetical protein H311_01771 [Anncaliia algerae PRA109]|nr:hypothetical protein H311_01771 [Anncaliia algerae PRA109]
MIAVKYSIYLVNLRMADYFQWQDNNILIYCLMRKDKVILSVVFFSLYILLLLFLALSPSHQFKTSLYNYLCTFLSFFSLVYQYNPKSSILEALYLFKISSDLITSF